jgi:NAD(P)-dependent dehydrogenase (short-subunit alcohol dehydrogenase family)
LAAAEARYPDLAGRTVLVTGGGSGIGAEFVRAFSRQGCKVGFLDIAEAPSRALVESLKPASVHFEHCDVRDIPSLKRAIASVAAALGPITVLVNNAARDDRHAMMDVTVEYWDENQAVNLRHQVFATQAVVPMMEAAGKGSVINLGSISWMRGRPAMVGYTTAKAAVGGLTRVLSRELGTKNIRVNAIVPGAIVTERQTRLWNDAAAEHEFLEQQALKFRLSEDDVAQCALFLASDVSRGVTGQNLIVDAGLAQTSVVS